MKWVPTCLLVLVGNMLVVWCMLYSLAGGEGLDGHPSLRSTLPPTAAPTAPPPPPAPVAVDVGPGAIPHLTYDGSKFASPLPYREVTSDLPAGYVKSWLFTYPPWVLPPPLSVEAGVHHPVMERSQFQRNELSESRFYCSLPNATVCCRAPRHCLRDYHPRDCETDGLHCGFDEDFVVNSHPKYRFGRVDFIKDGTLDFRTFDCGWKSNHADAVQTLSGAGLVYIADGPVIYLDVPMGFLYQHFLDGTIPKMLQVESLLRDPAYKLFMEVNQGHHPIVHKLLQRMGIGPDRIIYRGHLEGQYRYIRSPLLVVPCNTPPIHPHLWRRAQYLLKLPYLEESQGAVAEREVVAYLTRSNGAQGERHVTNDGEVIQFLRDYFAGSRYEFIVFIASNYPSLESNIAFWARVRVMIGPHGGAFQNVLFTRAGVTMVEFQLDRGPYLSEAVRFIMHRQGVMMGHDYYSMLCQSTGLSMSVNTKQLKEILDFAIRL